MLIITIYYFSAVEWTYIRVKAIVPSHCKEEYIKSFEPLLPEKDSDYYHFTVEDVEKITKTPYVLSEVRG